MGVKIAEELLGKTVPVKYFKDIYNKVSLLKEPLEVKVLSCYSHAETDGFIINGGLYLHPSEIEDLLNV